MADESYKIPRWFVGFVTTFIVLAIPWCSWVTIQLMDQKVSFAVESNKKAIDEMKSHMWTIEAQSEYTLRAALLNPGIQFPDPREPGKSIIINKGKITDAKIDPNTITSLYSEYGLSGSD